MFLASHVSHRSMGSRCLAVMVGALALTIPATSALAFGWMSLNWGADCAGPISTDFRCNTNSTSVSWPMTVSFKTDMAFDLVGLDLSLVGCPGGDGVGLPDWWKLGTADCRASKVEFTADLSAMLDGACWQWAGPSVITSANLHWSGNRSYIEASASLPEGALPVTTERLVQYYAGRVTILNGKTMGTDACAGCNQPFQWIVAQVHLHGADGQSEVITESFGDLIWWNSAFPPCVNADPARNATWGRIKSLYR